MTDTIVLFGPSVDGAGNYCDAGTELTVATTDEEATQAGFIHADRAKELNERSGAVPADQNVGDDLDSLRVAQLREIAAQEGAVVEGDANKATIIQAIRAKRAAAPTA